MEFQVSVDDNEFVKANGSLSNDVYEVKGMKVQQPTLWSPSSPYLWNKKQKWFNRNKNLHTMILNLLVDGSKKKK